MILVLLGTHELQFTRLLEEIERCIGEGIIQEKVVVQAGNTKYLSDKMEILDFLSYNQLEERMKETSYIITHGGTGSITSALRSNKKVIAIPRLKKYNEHNDDHQVEILKAFEKKRYIKACYDMNVGKCIQELEDFRPECYQTDNSKMINLLKEFIR
ncbi:MAG: PssE/Cps14G family polysaccharide biosynthesis glycosyltransferase [Eubacteriales bacterium]